MHVLAFSGRALPGRLDEGVAIFNDEVVDLVRANEHLCQVQLLADMDGRFWGLFHANGECGPGVLRQLHEQVRQKLEHLIQGQMRFRQWEVAVLASNEQGLPEIRGTRGPQRQPEL